MDASDRRLIRLEGVSKSFGEQKVLVELDLEVNAGDVITVLGRSGSGKSVLLKLLVGLQCPDSGRIWLDGQDVNSLPLEALNELRKQVGFLFQNAALYDSLSVEDNVAFPLRRHSGHSDDEIRQRVHDLLTSVGLKQDPAKMPADISGGMKKRVGLARALALDPKILLLDEPTAGLDPITTTEIGELILNLRKQRDITCVMVTHEMRAARQLSDHFVVLNEGKAVAEGSYEALQKSQDPMVIRYLSSVA